MVAEIIKAQGSGPVHKFVQTAKFALAATVVAKLIWRTNQPQLVAGGFAMTVLGFGWIDRSKNLEMNKKGWRPILSGALAASLLLTTRSAFSQIHRWSDIVRYGSAPAFNAILLAALAKDDHAAYEFVSKWS
jgi:UDP-N-acetylmuramyl pentapeptide phosphotransferase/UDP-N-acetylglucosamine-1-phosphate transferase